MNEQARKVLKISDGKKETEEDMSLVLHGVKVKEKVKGQIVGTTTTSKLLWIEEGQGTTDSFVFVADKEKRTRSKQPGNGLPLLSIARVDRVEERPRRISLVGLDGNVAHVLELPDAESASRIKHSLERFRKDSQERIIKLNAVRREEREKQEAEEKTKK